MDGKGWALDGYEDFTGRDRQAELRERAQRQSQEVKKKQNNHDYAVEYVAVKCPRCGSKKNKKYKHTPPVRYHKCLNCGNNFKSVEKK